MDNAMMIGLARQITLRRAMDVAANNIANAQTSGFKAERLFLETERATPARSADGPRRLDYVDEWRLGRDFRQGRLEPTARDLDFAIDGEGFFAVETPAGPRYTRDGRFTLDGEGFLTALDGSRVLDDQGAPIALDLNAGPVGAASDGTLTQNGAALARLGVVAFDDLSVLEKTGGNRYRAPEDAAPAPLEAALVRQGYVEGSNVEGIFELTRILEVSRAYTSVTRMIQQTDELSRRALERLGRP